MTYKTFLKSIQKEDTSRRISPFNDKAELLQFINENFDSRGQNKSKKDINNNNIKQESIDITKLNVYNKYFQDIIKFPRHNLDLDPLKYDLPYSEVVKLFKHNNEFLFKNTNEDKFLFNKLKKLNLDSFEVDKNHSKYYKHNN